MWDGGPPTRDQPAPGPPGPPGVQVPPRLTLGPIIRQPEQGLASAVLLKALPVPLYHMVPPGTPQPRAALAPGSLDVAGLPFILSPLLRPEASGPAQVGKPPAPVLTVNLVGAVPVLSPGLGTPLGSPGKARSAGRHLCPHCARDCLKPSVLEKHIRSHTGERPFPCATCGIAFKTQSNLYKHRRTQTHLSNARRGSDGTTPEDCPDTAPPSADTEPPADPPGQPLRRLPDKSPTASRPCPLQRQQATSWERAWDPRASEGRLRKCESSDSGYLSRSDSAEQPPVTPSPLQGPAEREAEGLGPGGRVEPPELEKRRLEERIARLISLNQALVDDPQLDTVRPRKTALSKQGSIDLPLPYTYKDSFHFDMRPPEPGRRRQAPLGSVRSTCTPPERTRPLSFHSVPTQLSSTVECVSVTRSNSLPFVEGARSWCEWGPDPQEAGARGPRPFSPRLSPALRGPALWAAPSSHPRALVRQAAVEDLPATPAGESPGPLEDPQKTTAGEGAAGRARAPGRRGGQRRSKMFSQEKWQVYGDETFKRIYLRGRAGPQGGKKEAVGRVEPLPQTEATQKGSIKTPVCVDGRTPVSGDTRTPECGDRRTPECGNMRTPVSGDTRIPERGDMRTLECGDRKTPVKSSLCEDSFPPVAVSSGAELGSQGGRVASEFSVVTSPPKARSGGSSEPRVSRATTAPTLTYKDTPSLGCEGPQLPPNGDQEPRAEMSPDPSPVTGGDSRDPKQDRVCGSDGTETGTCLWVQGAPRLPSGGLEQSVATKERLPSERKKLRVEGLSGQDRSEPLAVGGKMTEVPEVPAQPLSLPARDSNPPGPAGGLLPRADPLRHGWDMSLVPTGSSSAPLTLPRQTGPRDKKPPVHPAALPPRPYLQAPDNTFTPKYLLRLPQGQPPGELPPERGCGQGQDALCRREWPAEPDPVGSGVGMSQGPGPASLGIPGDTDGIHRDHARCRADDELRGVEERLALRPPEPLAPASTTLSPCPCLVCTKCEDPTVRCDCFIGVSVMAPGGAPNPWPQVWEKAPGDPPPGSWMQLGSHYSFPLAITQPPAWLEAALLPHSGNCGARGPFPSLGAEPRLTWCCLSRSLPLPAEQKRTASVYSSLHRPVQKDGAPEGRIVTSQGDPGPAQMSKLSCLAAPGMTPQVSELKSKKRWPRRSPRMPCGSGRQKKLRINPKRYRGAFVQNRVQLRASRLYNPRWLLRGACHRYPREGQHPRKSLPRTSPDAAGNATVQGLNPQGEPSGGSSEPSLCLGGKEKNEDDARAVSEALIPSTSPRNVKDRDAVPVKDSSPPAGEGSNCFPRSPVTGAGSPLQSHSCLVVGKDHHTPCGAGLDPGLLETQRLLRTERTSIDHNLGFSAEARELSPFEATGTFLCHDIATSGAAICTSLGSRVVSTTLGIPSAEPPHHGWASQETQAQSPIHMKAVVGGTAPCLLPEKPSDALPLESTENTLLEIPASSPNNSHHVEGRHETFLPSWGQCECGGNGNKKDQGAGSATSKDCLGSASPERPPGILGAPSKTTKKRGLEGVRKQTQVELSDTSSDDEDRLVIEEI